MPYIQFNSSCLVTHLCFIFSCLVIGFRLPDTVLYCILRGGSRDELQLGGLEIFLGAAVVVTWGAFFCLKRLACKDPETEAEHCGRANSLAVRENYWTVDSYMKVQSGIKNDRSKHTA